MRSFPEDWYLTATFSVVNRSHNRQWSDCPVVPAGGSTKPYTPEVTATGWMKPTSFAIWVTSTSTPSFNACSLVYE